MTSLAEDFKGLYAPWKEQPLLCLRNLLKGIRAMTFFDHASVSIYVPDKAVVVSFNENGGYGMRHLTENSCYNRWRTANVKAFHIVEQNAQRFSDSFPDEWLDFGRGESFFTLAIECKGCLWGSLTVAHSQARLISKDVAHICSEMVDEFKITRMPFLSDLCSTIYELKAATSVQSFVKELTAFFLRQSPAAAASMALLHPSSDRAVLFIDKGRLGLERKFHEESISLKDDSVAGKMKKSRDSKMEVVMVKPKKIDPERQVDSDVARLVPQWGGCLIHVYPMKKPPQSFSFGMTLSLGCLGFQVESLVGVIYLQARYTGVFAEVGPRIQSVIEIFSRLLNEKLRTVHFSSELQRHVDRCNASVVTDIPQTKKSSELMPRLKEVVRQLENERRRVSQRRSKETNGYLENLKLEELQSLQGSSRMVVSGTHEEKKVAVKVFPSNRQSPKEMAITSVISHKNIVKALRGNADVSSDQLIRCCPPCTCPKDNCQYHRIISALSQLGTGRELRISLFDILITEFCNGGTLRSWIFREGVFRQPGNNGKLDAKVFLLTSLEIAEVLQYLHSQKISHGDVNPDNIFTMLQSRSDADPRGWTVKMADFGNSRMVGYDTGPPQKGAMAYMPPEFMGMNFVTQRMDDERYTGDVYAFAIIMWQMIEKKHPYEEFRSDSIELQSFVQNRNRPLLTMDCPNDIRELLQRCWHHNPEIRPTSSSIVHEIKILIQRHCQ